jgi:hypothetical protein
MHASCSGVPVEGKAEGLEADPELARAKTTQPRDLQGSKKVEEAQDHHQRAWDRMPVEISHLVRI